MTKRIRCCAGLTAVALAAAMISVAGCRPEVRPAHVAVGGFKPFDKVESAVVHQDGRLVITVIERGQQRMHESTLTSRTLHEGGTLIVVTDDNVQHEIPFTIAP